MRSISPVNCDYVLLGPLLVWAVIGLYLSAKLARHGLDGVPYFFDAWRKRSYTPEGQRWLKWLRVFAATGPLVVFTWLIIANAICPLEEIDARRVGAPSRTFVLPPVLFAALSIWAAVGWFMLVKLLRHGRDGQKPPLRRLLSNSSYPIDGQQWLKRLRLWIVGGTVAFWFALFLIW